MGYVRCDAWSERLEVIAPHRPHDPDNPPRTSSDGPSTGRGIPGTGQRASLGQSLQKLPWDGIIPVPDKEQVITVKVRGRSQLVVAHLDGYVPVLIQIIGDVDGSSRGRGNAWHDTADSGDPGQEGARVPNDHPGGRERAGAGPAMGRYSFPRTDSPCPLLRVSACGLRPCPVYRKRSSARSRCAGRRRCIAKETGHRTVPRTARVSTPYRHR